jgi:hypothetical protein
MSKCEPACESKKKRGTCGRNRTAVLDAQAHSTTRMREWQRRRESGDEDDRAVTMMGVRNQSRPSELQDG